LAQANCPGPARDGACQHRRVVTPQSVGHLEQLAPAVLRRIQFGRVRALAHAGPARTRTDMRPRVQSLRRRGRTSRLPRSTPPSPRTRALHKSNCMDFAYGSPWSKLLLDSGEQPRRIGAVLGFDRFVDPTHNRLNWAERVRLADYVSHGRTSLRCIAALLELLGHDVPEQVARNATAGPSETALYLGDRKTHGASGERLPTWSVVVNMDLAAIAEQAIR